MPYYGEGEVQKVTKKGIKSLDRATAWIEKEKKRCGNKPCAMPAPPGDFSNVGLKKTRR